MGQLLTCLFTAGSCPLPGPASAVLTRGLRRVQPLFLVPENALFFGLFPGRLKRAVNGYLPCLGPGFRARSRGWRGAHFDDVFRGFSPAVVVLKPTVHTTFIPTLVPTLSDP